MVRFVRFRSLTNCWVATTCSSTAHLRLSYVHFDSNFQPGNTGMYLWCSLQYVSEVVEDIIYHQGFFYSVRRNPSLNCISDYYWRRRTQVADKAVSPSCFRSSLSILVVSTLSLFCPSVVFESCNVFRPFTFSPLDNVDDVIFTCLMSFPGITFVDT